MACRHQAIIWTNAGILLTGTSGTNFSEILIEIWIFSFKKMGLKVSSAKWQPFCLGLNVLSARPSAGTVLPTNLVTSFLPSFPGIPIIPNHICGQHDIIEILLSTLKSVASDLFNYALRLDNELSARPPRGRHGLWTGLKTQMGCLQIVWWKQ